VDEAAPGFELPLVGGGNVSLASLRGQTVLIDFWATWCPPCLEEVPELNAISRELEGKGASVLAISVDNLTLEALGEWLAERDVKYPVALGDTDLAGVYGADAFPFHVVLGPDGKVLERLESGFHDREQLRAVLARHMKH
jgi:peroxiredoxin